MVDTTITLTPSAAMTTGPITVTASAALFSAADVGRHLSIRQTPPGRAANTAYGVAQVFIAGYAGVDRLYRVTGAGTTAAQSLAGTTPNYDLNAPREIGNAVTDGTCVLKYLGQGRHVWGFGIITGYTSATQVTVTVDPRGPFVAAAGSYNWKLGDWSDARGWPAAVTIHAGRVWYLSSTTRPQTLWAGNTGDFDNMTPTEPDGTVLDTHAITITLDDDQINRGVWCRTFKRDLAVGTASAEFTVGAATNGGAIAPNNVRALHQTDRGSATGVTAHRVSGVILFVEAGGRKVRQLEFDLGTDSFQTADLTQLADHITGEGVIDSAYQGRPDGTLWLVRSDGVLATLTFDREQRVRAWSRQVLGGEDARAESIAIVPSPDGASHDVYLAVTRTVAGVAHRTIEYIRAPFRADLEEPEDGFFVDCGLTYRGAGANTFSGLEHLEKQWVQIIGDGSPRNQAQVRDGTVIMTGPLATVAHIGLPFTARVETMSPEAGAAGGTAQGQQRRINEITIRFLDSGGGRYGRAGALEPLVFRTSGDAMDRPVPLFTGDRRVVFPSGWTRDATVIVETADGLPMTILGLIQGVDANA